nr:hypothetical protein [Tanacetum cinerariifolium]
MTPEAVQTMIDQALLRNSGGEDRSHSSHVENPRNMHIARPCYYADFMKCHRLNFKGTEGAVGLTSWIEKMESVFNISGETEKVDKYISGLPDNIYGNVKSSKPKTADDISKNNHQPFKKQNVAKSYNLGSAKKKNYEGNAPKSTGNNNATNNRGGNGPNPRGNGCFECGNPGHFKRDCPKLNNKNGGNRNAQGWVYAVGNAERNGNATGNPDSNIVTVQEYKAKGCHVFLAQISATKEEDKPERKQVKDVPIVQDFPEV